MKVTKPVAGKAITTLITAAGIGPTGGQKSGDGPGSSGLIMLLHVNADEGRAVWVNLPERYCPSSGAWPGKNQRRARVRWSVADRADGGATYLNVTLPETV